MHGYALQKVGPSALSFSSKPAIALPNSTRGHACDSSTVCKSKLWLHARAFAAALCSADLTVEMYYICWQMYACLRLYEIVANMSIRCTHDHKLQCSGCYHSLQSACWIPSKSIGAVTKLPITKATCVTCLQLQVCQFVSRNKRRSGISAIAAMLKSTMPFIRMPAWTSDVQ